ncbi:MAG TPA: VOC family protein [Rhizomicrobium sp.]|jgi:hypothetical protein
MLRHHALLVRVPDLRLGVAFYAARLGPAETRVAEDFVRLGDSLYLEQVSPAPGPAFDQARAFTTFTVPDLDTEALAAEARDPLTTTPRPVRGGRCLRMRDPFGNVQVLLEPREGMVRAAPSGIKIPIASVPAARHLYGDFLCFAQNGRHYPPQLAMNHRDGSPAFTIEDKEIWEPDVRVRAPLYPNETGAVLVFTFPDLAELHANLARRAVRLTPIVDFPLGKRMGIVDPAGLASEIWQFA